MAGRHENRGVLRIRSWAIGHVEQRSDGKIRLTFEEHFSDAKAIALRLAQQLRVREQLNAYLDGLAAQYTAKRASEVAEIHSRTEAEARQAAVRKKLLALIGELPKPTPLPVGAELPVSCVACSCAMPASGSTATDTHVEMAMIAALSIFKS
jgi:hypothetical protein